MKELFMFDIETVGEYPDFETFKSNDERGAKLFESKYHKMRWNEKYTDINEAYIDNNESKQIRSFYGDDEMDIVNSFNNLLMKIETKNFNLSGFRIVHFDLPWILHKLHKYEIKPANIIYMYDKKPWDMRITDMSDDWRGKFAWAFSFDELAYELGVPSPKDIISGSDVHKYYWNGKIEDIKTYCEKDVEASIEVSKIIYKK